MELLRKEVEARELNQDIALKDKGKSYSDRKEAHSGFTPSASALASFGETKTNWPNCIFCKGNHFSSSCTKVSSIKDRSDHLLREKRCFRCLRGGHFVRECRGRKCRKCDGNHHQSLCEKEMAGKNQAKKEDRTKRDTDADTERQDNHSVTATNKKHKPGILLQTARTYAFKDDQDAKVPIRILFDSGSQLSYVSENLRQKLDLRPIGNEVININTFGTEKYRKHNCAQVEVSLETAGNNHVKIKALSYPTICSPVKSNVTIESFEHLLGLELADDPCRVESEDESIDLLIGLNYYYDFVIGDVIRGEHGPVAVRSKLGWLISGSVEANTETDSHVYTSSNLIVEEGNQVVSEGRQNDELLKTFQKVFEVEPIESAKDLEVEKVEFIKSCDVKFNGERYEVGLPWRKDITEPLSSDYTLCLECLKSLYSRLHRDPELLDQYDSYFQEQVKNGIIERVAEPEEGKQVHFIAHHGVFRTKRQTSKLRIVFDASAKSKPDSLSLNDMLENGPNFVPSLFDTLIDFRCHRIALTADIEKAFLQVSIKESDRDFLRFLWFDSVKGDNPSIVQYRFCRLPFGLKPSPSILGATMHKHVNEYREKYPLVSGVLDHCYVDDVTSGSDSVEEGLEIYRAAKEITNAAGFNLRKWNTNSKELLSHVEQLEHGNVSNHEIAIDSFSAPGTESSSETSTQSQSTNNQVKVLGVSWDTELDELKFSVCDVLDYANKLPTTKRSVLKISAKIFDPLGVLSPFVIKLKSFFQQLCVEKVDWDKDLQGQLRLKYRSLLSELNEITDISFPRYLFQDEKVVSVQLHGFSDASETAFASVVYLRVEYEDGKIEVKFLSSKARVSPIKGQSIPRLELLGACLLAKHLDSVRQALSFEDSNRVIETTLWTDSYTVLCWIRNPKPWKQYVRSRVEQILNVSSRGQWRFCPGSLNPADIPSRGFRRSGPSQNKVWLEGPEFLKLPQNQWPKDIPTSNVENEEALKEITRNQAEPTFALLNRKVVGNSKLKDIVDINRFSSKTKLLRVVAWIFRFINNLRSKQKVQGKCMNASELEKAENFVIRHIQEESFPSELEFLTRSDKHVARKPPLLVSQFNLFVDREGIIRANSRIKNAFVETERKEPILLPSKGRFSELVVREYHNRVYHNGVRETLNATREKYWILRGREIVKKLVRRCVVCKKLEGLPYKPIWCQDLPPTRLDEGPPFINTGVDFAGPLYVATKKGSSKVYICLFTCASTRAIHLELVESLDIPSFLRAFRRFSARRGLPRTIMSDNAKTFKGAMKDVKRIILSDEVQTHLADRGISWHFIVQRAAWYGAIWERLVRSVKRCLKKVIGRTSLIYEELTTLLVEVESIINARPITYVYDDVDGVSYPLTPSQLISGYNTTRSPNGRHFEVISTNESLTRRAKYHRRLLQEFSKRWKHEYLLGIREATGLSDPSKKPNMSIGDVVVLKDEQTKRAFWKIAIIEELIVSRDDNIRAAKVRVATNRGTSILTRSLKHLVPLEISCNANVIIPKPPESQEPIVPTVSNIDRPRRNAAIIGELNRRDNM